MLTISRQCGKKTKCRSWGKAKHGVGTSGRDQTRTTKIEKKTGQKNEKEKLCQIKSTITKTNLEGG